VPVPCFLLFLCFRKAIQEIFSELDETKAEVHIFSDTRRSPKQRWRGARGQPHHRAARPTPGPLLIIVNTIQMTSNGCLDDIWRVDY
jgi:hypothetical protein